MQITNKNQCFDRFEKLRKGGTDGPRGTGKALFEREKWSLFFVVTSIGFIDLFFVFCFLFFVFCVFCVLFCFIH